jgi:ATP-dependent Lon protease
VHVPAGAVPEDDPAAGITMTTALVSLLTGRTVTPTVGMTGELTLQAEVLPNAMAPIWRTCPSGRARR